MIITPEKDSFEKVDGFFKFKKVYGVGVGCDFLSGGRIYLDSISKDILRSLATKPYVKSID